MQYKFNVYIITNIQVIFTDKVDMFYSFQIIKKNNNNSLNLKTKSRDVKIIFKLVFHILEISFNKDYLYCTTLKY